uniref:Spindle and centriole-associated protein 1 n=1 Tax=Mesocestoides corti TaxID=53468 RepID=A0A5K3ERD1_MESCO
RGSNSLYVAEVNQQKLVEQSETTAFNSEPWNTSLCRTFEILRMCVIKVERLIKLHQTFQQAQQLTLYEPTRRGLLK